MKAYLKILPYMGIVLGLLGLLLLLSFTNTNACQIANSDVISIKAHTEKALEMNTLEMSRYHTFKALSSLEKTKTNLNDCGCEPALVTAKDAEMNLKRATRSKNLKDSKGFLKIALQNALITLDALNNYDEANSSTYGNDVLVMNTKEVLNDQGGILLSPQKQLEERMNKSISEFETSLEAVVQHVDCADAFSFINKIIDKSNRQLKKKTLSKAQGQYHLRIKTIAHDALLKLEGCPTK